MSEKQLNGRSQLVDNSQPEKYDPSTLSDAEKKRFVTALADGFGYSYRAFRSHLLEEYSLPSEVEAGLLKHRAYYDKRRHPQDYDGEESDKFWEESDGDSPPGIFEQCPVNFDLAAILPVLLERRDHLVSLSEQRWRNCNTACLGGFSGDR